MKPHQPCGINFSWQWILSDKNICIFVQPKAQLQIPVHFKCSECFDAVKYTFTDWVIHWAYNPGAMANNVVPNHHFLTDTSFPSFLFHSESPTGRLINASRDGAQTEMGHWWAISCICHMYLTTESPLYNDSMILSTYNLFGEMWGISKHCILMQELYYSNQFYSAEKWSGASEYSVYVWCWTTTVT